MTAETYNNSSLESQKKNIEEYKDKVLDLVKNNKIYKYNFKTEQNGDKKHIGFIIADNGGNYKTPNEVISSSKEGVDVYAMTSILWKAVQEYVEKTDVQIEQMKKEIKELKGGK